MVKIWNKTAVYILGNGWAVVQVNTHFVAVCFMGELFMCTCRIMHGEWVSNVGKVYHEILPLGGGRVEKPSPGLVKICAYTCFLKIDFISQR